MGTSCLSTILRIWRVASSPSSTGICRSIRMTSERLLRHLLHRLAAVVHHGDLGLHPAQVLQNELLVDPVVLGQQHPGTAQQLPELLLIPCASAWRTLLSWELPLSSSSTLASKAFSVMGLAGKGSVPCSPSARAAPPWTRRWSSGQAGAATGCAGTSRGPSQAILLTHAPVGMARRM